MPLLRTHGIPRHHHPPPQPQPLPAGTAHQQPLDAGEPQSHPESQAAISQLDTTVSQGPQDPPEADNPTDHTAWRDRPTYTTRTPPPQPQPLPTGTAHQQPPAAGELQCHTESQAAIPPINTTASQGPHDPPDAHTHHSQVQKTQGDAQPTQHAPPHAPSAPPLQVPSTNSPHGGNDRPPPSPPGAEAPVRELSLPQPPGNTPSPEPAQSCGDPSLPNAHTTALTKRRTTSCGIGSTSRHLCPPRPPPRYSTTCRLWTGTRRCCYSAPQAPPPPSGQPPSSRRPPWAKASETSSSPPSCTSFDTSARRSPAPTANAHHLRTLRLGAPRQLRAAPCQRPRAGAGDLHGPHLLPRAGHGPLPAQHHLCPHPGMEKEGLG